MTTRNNSENAPKLTELVEKPGKQTLDALEKLKASVLDSELKKAIDGMIDVGTRNNGDIPQKNIDAFKNSLNESQKKQLAAFMANEDPAGKLSMLAASTDKGVTKGPEITAGSNAEKIVGAIGGVVDKMGIGSKLTEVAQKFGFKGEIGDQSTFVKNMLVGMAAKVFENLAFALKSFNPDIDKMLTVSIDLRIFQLGLKGKDAETYRAAYLKRAEGAANLASFTPPGSLKDAVAIMNPPKKADVAIAKADEKKSDDKTPAKESATGDATKKTNDKAPV